MFSICIVHKMLYWQTPIIRTSLETRRNLGFRGVSLHLKVYYIEDKANYVTTMFFSNIIINNILCYRNQAIRKQPMILDDDSDDEDDDFDEKKVTVPLTVTMIVIAGKLLNMSISLRSTIVKAMWSIILQLC